MDREARSRLRKIVIQSRGLLEEDFRTQLIRLGIEEGGKSIPVGRLQHLTKEDRQLREKIQKAIDKEQGKKIRRTEAYDRYVRHVGFTYLNRIAALRAMEVRGLLQRETILRRDQYAGMSETAYLIAEREGLFDPGEIIRRCLLEAFDEVSQEIKVLFDMDDEYSLLFPSTQVLDQVIELLSVKVPEKDWLEDDIIGWIYQYYNSEARSEFRKRRRKPRADDIPVINQFYTPRWLVRVLVDNTLGRFWLEMKGRMPKPGETEAPSEERLRTPQGDTVDEYCSYLIPPKQDHLTREEKSVREIKVLDPACGSGHFLVYAFNVLYRMYLEDEPDTPREDIPKFILENNLYGIDIDLRSVQLAALSLYLKAKEYNPGVKIERMNLVCADARIIDGDLQKAFLKSLGPDIDLQRIFSKIFDELEYTYDVGSLLKVRQPFERLINERGLAKVQFHLRPTGQSTFSEEGGLSAQTTISLEEQRKAVLVKPAVTLEEMLGALVKFEREGMEKKDMGTMLFAAEAEKSVGLLSLLSRRYDVVVMNPPYGDMPKSTKQYAREYYPRTHYDYYAAFIEQAINLCKKNCFIGMLTGRTFMFLRYYEKVRKEILYKESKPELILDLGYEILDEATGIWAATAIRNLSVSENYDECIFMRLFDYRGEESKKDAFNEIISKYLMGYKHDDAHFVRLKSLLYVPRMSYCYWVPKRLREIYGSYPPLDRDLAQKKMEIKVSDAKVGIQTGYDDRFIRFFWEVNNTEIGLSITDTLEDKIWVPFIKGSWLKPFYFDISLVIKWDKNGKDIKDYAEKTGKPRVQNEQFYFREGISWIVAPQLGSILKGTLHSINSFYLPKGCIFSVSGSAMFPSPDNIWSILGLLNSSLYYYLVRMITPRLLHVGYMAQLPFPVNNDLTQIEQLTKEAFDVLKEWETGNEISVNFIEPWLLQSKGKILNKKPVTNHPLSQDFFWSNWDIANQIRNLYNPDIDSIQELLEMCNKREIVFRKRLNEIPRLLDEEVYDVFNIEEKERKIIKKQVYKIEEVKKDKDIIQISNKEHISRLFSYYIKNILNEVPEGIIIIDTLVNKVREKLKKDFGNKNVEKIEHEIEEILEKNIYDWLIEDFFEFHVSLYTRRPIIWHITSSFFSRKQRKSGAFNCFVYYHQIGRDTIPKIRTRPDYLKGLLDGLKWRTERLRRELQEAEDSGNKSRERQLQSEYEEALDEYMELLEFDQKLEEVTKPLVPPTELDEGASWVEEKITEVKDNGYNPVIDYGVLVNITPLKEAGLLHPAADRVK